MSNLLRFFKLCFGGLTDIPNPFTGYFQEINNVQGKNSYTYFILIYHYDFNFNILITISYIIAKLWNSEFRCQDLMPFNLWML